MSIPEPFNSMALVMVGALFGGLAWGWWCGCLPRLRWRRRWHALAERNGQVFYEFPAEDAARLNAHLADFLSRCEEKRQADRAAKLKEAAK